MLPSEAVVRDIAVDPFDGLTSYTAGNGVTTRRTFDSAGQRVAKAVFDAEGQERVTFFLWQDGNRVAEIDGSGMIATQFLYLAEGQRATPVAQLDGDRILAIHTDQRGAPFAMTDGNRRVVWHAEVGPWGTASPANGNSFGTASMNLRLPGQYYDEETGLHDNGFRTYNPLSGLYLQPDPLGTPDGPDPYRYAGGDPINRVDPAGLYAIDAHYYMTYFLALSAGLDEKTAGVVATADQTMDDVNPYTDALPHPTPWDADSAKARERYHFTQTSTAWDPLNDQTQKLLGYAKSASNPCLKAQFYGEFMHAYQDTFAHRDRNNVPYSTDGHLDDLTSPDKTYNHDFLYVYHWTGNETRTLLAEQAVFDQIRFDWDVSAKNGNGNTITFASLQPFLTEWNKIQDDGTKITRVKEELKALGFKEIDNYDKYAGLACRLKYFRQAGLIGDNGRTTLKGVTDYSDAILDTVTNGATTCKY